MFPDNRKSVRCSIILLLQAWCIRHTYKLSDNAKGLITLAAAFLLCCVLLFALWYVTTTFHTTIFDTINFVKYLAGIK
jgi:uncharacterized membrane protein YhdT